MRPAYKPSEAAKLRLAAGLRQVDLARRAKTSVFTIIQVENGRTGVSLRIAARIAKVIGCTIDAYFSAIPLRRSKPQRRARQAA